ncbi:LytR/AlgR family response regulator transcription factor [Sinomicrobium soli]|uniref:LytR/AlgR family response regulator transcription factor n=1 Tax=Sinomicrobium sp. N-1-3-6 TaxID=2219864 RepID=UPI000DCC8788|nr:LytTR family DNA-binding domain-containing protein [Sinomicrobium sp. N-1-3-6]RAV29557.1 DNA-binding response regulator [Sinomicrobium sp. N-1-3-6]
MRIAILDDELHCVESLVLHIRSLFPELPIVYKSTKATEALEALQRLDIDLLFLDVEMPQMNGFDFLEQFDELTFDVIFTTAYSQYAVKAFRAQAVNYLLKPVDEDELRDAISQCMEKQNTPGDPSQEIARLLKHLKDGEVLKNKIAIPTAEGLEFIEIPSIVYCQSQSNYTTIYTDDGRSLVISRTLKEVEKSLKKFLFARVHQSYLVNPNYMEKYSRNDGGYLVMTNKKRIPISNSKRNVIIDIFESLRRS